MIVLNEKFKILGLKALNFDEDILTIVKQKEIRKSHSCNSNKELKLADCLGEAEFFKFERILTNFLDVESLSCIDVVEPRFFDSWTLESDDIICIRKSCEQNMVTIKGTNISFDMIKCRYKSTPFIIGRWRYQENNKKYKCNIYIKKKISFQDIYNEITNPEV